VKLPIFYGENYNLWKMIIQGNLISLGVYVYSNVVSEYDFPDVLPSDPDGKKIFLEQCQG